MQFCPHICMWVIHRSLLQAVLEDLGLPQCGSGVEVTWLFGSWEPQQCQVCREAGNIGPRPILALTFCVALNLLTILGLDFFNPKKIPLIPVYI